MGSFRLECENSNFGPFHVGVQYSPQIVRSLLKDVIDLPEEKEDEERHFSSLSVLGEKILFKAIYIHWIKDDKIRSSQKYCSVCFFKFPLYPSCIVRTCSSSVHEC